MPSNESKLFLWGGLAVGGSGIFWIVPGINALMSVVAIAGLILIVSRLGYLRAVLSAGIATLLVMLIGSLAMGEAIGAINTAIFLIAVVAPGISMGVASRAFASPGKTVWYGTIPILGLLIVLLVFYSDFITKMPSLVQEVNASLEKTLDQSPQLSKMLEERYGVDGAREKFIEEMDKFVIFLIRLLPGTIIIGFLAIITLGLAAAGSVASRMKIMIPRFPPFYLWRASDWWLLPTAIGLALAIFMNDDFWRYFGANILVVTGNIYALVGLSALEAFLRRLSVPPVIRIIFYAVLILTAFLGMIFLAILGLADSRFNFKRENLDRDANNME